MERGVIKKEKLKTLFQEAGKERRIFVPAAGEKGIEFRAYENGDELLFEYSNAKLSPKGIFFPQAETLYTYENSSVADVPSDEQDYLVFGARPCDVQAVVYLDKVFRDTNSRFLDPYYLKRREDSILISLACTEPCETCFCTSVGGGPAASEGADILAHDLGSELLFDAVSEAGREFMGKYEQFFEEDGKKADEAAKQAEEQTRKAEESIAVFDITGLKEKLDDEFNSRLWEPVTAHCLGCGACTYLCPTCHCFDITDEDNGRGAGKRIRTWDSCQYPQFTLHASGHNPRTNKTQRMRQRVMHKFSYTVENTGDIYCVGCGRCVVHCPVNLDIREVVRSFGVKHE